MNQVVENPFLKEIIYGGFDARKEAVYARDTRAYVSNMNVVAATARLVKAAA